MNKLILVNFLLVFNCYLVFSNTNNKDILTVFKKTSNKEIVADSLFNKGEYSKSLPYYKELLLINTALGKKENQIKIKSKLSTIYFYLGLYNTALEYGYQTLDYYFIHPNNKQPYEILNILGLVLTSNKNYNKALKYFLLALKIANKQNDITKKMYVFNNISTVYYYQNNLEKSFEYDKKVLNLAKLNNDSLALAASYNNIGAHFIIKNNFDSALFYNFESLKILNHINNTQRKAVTFGNIGEIYALKKNKIKAEFYLNKSYEFAKESGDRIVELGYYRRKYQLYQNFNDYKNANINLQKFNELKDSLHSSEKLVSLMNLQNIRHSVKKEKEINNYLNKIKELETKHLIQKKEKIIIYLIVISLIIIITLTFFIFKLKIKIKNQKLNVQKLEIEKQQQENLRLVNEIDIKNKELSLIAINIFHKSEAINKIENIVNKINEKDIKCSEKLISELKCFLKSQKTVDNEWKNFEKLFNKVHINFFNNLKKFEKLSQTDIRHCAYIKLQLNTKEIAGLLAISPKSVQISRVRLKKKLGLPKEKDLKDFIQSL